MGQLTSADISNLQAVLASGVWSSADVRADIADGPLCANNGLMRRSKIQFIRSPRRR